MHWLLDIVFSTNYLHYLACVRSSENKTPRCCTTKYFLELEGDQLFHIFETTQKTLGTPLSYSSGKKTFWDIVLCHFISCIVLFARSHAGSCASCIIIYSCGCKSSWDLVWNVIWDFARFRTIYRLGFCEISYEISFGILRDLVQNTMDEIL